MISFFRYVLVRNKKKKQDFVETCCTAGMLTAVATVLLHNGGFCNNCTPKTVLANINLEIYENYITLFYLEKINLLNIILTQNHAWHNT
jgi:hypothetical protein